MIKILHIKGINDAFISFVLAFFCLISFNAFSASDRIALIIGNSKYQNLGTLNNTINDAKAVEKSLKEMGYKTNLIADTNEIQLRKEIKRFAISSEKASLALFFYAGHGAQVLGENYILPTDLEIPQRESDIQLSGIKVDDIINSIKSKTKVIFLDACRDNPVLIKSLSKGRGSYSRGLAPTLNSSIIDSNSGVFIAYSTDSGNIALDGANSINSPFTSSLLKYIKEPISIDDMFSKVTKDVKEKTANKQKPYKYASIDGVVCLTGACSNKTTTTISSNQEYEDFESYRVSALRKNNGDINFQQLPERFEDEKNKLPKNYVLINFTKEAKMYFYIKPSTYKYYGNNRASIDTWAYYDDKSSLKDDELADGFAGHLVNCKEKKLGTYFVKALNKNNKIIQDAAYGEPEYATIDTILPPGSVLDAMANLVCNPYHLFPQVNEEEANNEENWTRIYTDVEGNDHFYLKNSIKKNGNIISAVIKDVYKDKKLNALDQFKILKTSNYSMNPTVSFQVGTGIHECGSNFYTIHDVFTYIDKGKLLSYSFYEKGHNDSESKIPFTENSAIQKFINHYCK